MFLLSVNILMATDITGDIDNELMKEQWTFVRFYAPWCAYTQISESKWNQLTESYGDKVRFVDVNCKQLGTKICKEKYDVRGYPAFKLYKNGRYFDLFKATLPRELDVFTEWLNRATSNRRDY
ncbi:Protein_disulfide isomerase PDI5 [Hexamita inflata]|uniref:Protein disulfide isomerase PDI5 n=1 Tax=Hexamita inflata TaxID=28002 RepID=A0AA86U3S7_9EUKA|nr:Protein disulfide isomerase PDI5 [Hexamita inflata]